MDVTITPVVLQDKTALQAIADATHKAQVYPLLSEEGIATLEADREARWRWPLNQDGYGSLKAMVFGEPVGYIRWRDEHFVFALYVALDYQGQGVGRQLLDAMLAQCPATEIRLRSSVNAVGFYRRYGFQAEGDEAVMRGIRFVPMVYCRD